METIVLQPAKRTPPNTSRNKSSNTQRTENKMTDVVIHQHSRKFLKMYILVSETCWAHNKGNKIASDIKLVFHSSTIAMMHGPINIRRQFTWSICTIPISFERNIFEFGVYRFWKELLCYKSRNWKTDVKKVQQFGDLWGCKYYRVKSHDQGTWIENPRSESRSHAFAFPIWIMVMKYVSTCHV